MKATLRQIVEANAAMSILGKRDWPSAKGSYWVSKLVRKLAEEYVHFELARNIAVKKYGEPVAGKPDSFLVPAYRIDEYNKEIEAMLAEEITLDDCVQIAWADIEAMRPVPAPAVLADLGCFVEAPPK